MRCRSDNFKDDFSWADRKWKNLTGADSSTYGSLVLDANICVNHFGLASYGNVILFLTFPARTTADSLLEDSDYFSNNLVSDHPLSSCNEVDKRRFKERHLVRAGVVCQLSSEGGTDIVDLSGCPQGRRGRRSTTATIPSKRFPIRMDTTEGQNRWVRGAQTKQPRKKCHLSGLPRIFRFIGSSEYTGSQTPYGRAEQAAKFSFQRSTFNRAGHGESDWGQKHPLTWIHWSQIFQLECGSRLYMAQIKLYKRKWK